MTLQKLYLSPRMRALPQRLMGSLQTRASIGTALLGLYALSGWSSPPLNHVAIVGLWLLLLTHADGRYWLLNHPLRRYLGVFILLISALSVRGMVLNPVHLPAQALETSKWLMLPGFMAVLYALEGHPRRAIALWIGLFLGLMVGFLTHVPLEAVFQFDATFERQPKFQFSRAGMVGLASSVALLGLTILLPRLMSLPKKVRILAFLSWGLSGYLTAFMLLSSQSRISWLALIIVAPLVLLVPSDIRERSQRRSAWPILAAGIFILLMVGGALRNMDGLNERMGKDWTFIAQQLRGDSHEIDDSASFSLRYRILRLGGQAIGRHPWLGWGNVGTSYIASLTGNEDFKIPDVPEGGERLIWITHLHSTYLEILARFGVAGFALFAFGFVLWWKALCVRSSDAQYPRELALFLKGTAGIMLIWGLTEFRASMEEWRVLFSMLAASTFLRPGLRPGRGRFPMGEECPAPQAHQESSLRSRRQATVRS